jgi:hypothetical protein
VEVVKAVDEAESAAQQVGAPAQPQHKVGEPATTKIEETATKASEQKKIIEDTQVVKKQKLCCC